MRITIFPARGGARTLTAMVATAVLVGSLAACASAPTVKITPPTMAPDQTLSEACAISGTEVDRLTVEAEQQVKAGLEEAAADLSAGKVPSFDFLAGPIDDTVAGLEAEISNPEVLSAISEVRTALQGFEEISQPDSPLAVPGYLGSLGSQLNSLARAGTQLKKLCVIEGASQPDEPEPNAQSEPDTDAQ